MHLAGEAILPAAAYELAKKALERAGKILALRPEDSAEVVSGGLLEAALASSKPADWIRKRCQVPSVVAQISVNRVPLMETGPRDVLDILVESEAAAVSASVAGEPADSGELDDEDEAQSSSAPTGLAHGVGENTPRGGARR